MPGHGRSGAVSAQPCGRPFIWPALPPHTHAAPAPRGQHYRRADPAAITAGWPEDRGTSLFLAPQGRDHCGRVGKEKWRETGSNEGGQGHRFLLAIPPAFHNTSRLSACRGAHRGTDQLQNFGTQDRSRGTEMRSILGGTVLRPTPIEILVLPCLLQQTGLPSWRRTYSPASTSASRPRSRRCATRSRSTY